MSCVNLKEQFLSYVDFNPHQSSYWNPPAFMKSCNQALCEVETLRVKVAEFDASIKKNRLRITQQQQSKMLHNLNQNIKICENHLKRLQIMTPDMKSSRKQFLEEYKSSVLATIQMKLLQIGLKFKQAYQKNRTGNTKSAAPISSNGSDQNSAPNLNRPLFIQQSQQQLMEQVAVAQYKGIEKSITKISQMYKQTASIVRMHQFMIDSIQADINETQAHVEGGRKNLTQAHRRQSKNRPLIIKVFLMLYITTTIYIVFLS